MLQLPDPELNSLASGNKAKPSPDAETKSEPAGDPPSEEPSSEEPPAEDGSEP